MPRPLFPGRWSMAGRATLWLAGMALLGVALTLLFLRLIDLPWLAVLTAVLLLAPIVAWSGSRLTSHWSRTSRALNDAVLSLKDRDFSVSVTQATGDELGELVASYNGLG